MTASLHPLPIALDDGRAPFNVTRQELATANRQLADVLELLEIAHRPIERLDQLRQELATIEAEIASLEAAHDARLATWLAEGQQGDRPQPSLKISLLEPRRALLARDSAASECLRGELEERYTRAAERVRQAQARRDEKIAAAAVDACAVFAAAWIAQLTEALRSEAILVGVADLLRTSAPAHSAQVAQLIAETRKSIVCARNEGPARRLLEQLHRDARAVLDPAA